MNRKKIFIIITLVIFIICTAVFLLISGERNQYKGKLVLTDSEGNTVKDPGTLNAGDVLYVSIEFDGTKRDETMTVLGIQTALTVSGMDYNNDGHTFSPAAYVSFNRQIVNETSTVDFGYYDLNRHGITIDNPCTIGSCSFTIKDPLTASISVTTGIVYPDEGEKEYVIKF